MTKEQCDSCQYPKDDRCRIIAKQLFKIYGEDNRLSNCNEYKKV